MKRILMILAALAVPLATFADVTGVWVTQPNEEGRSGYVKVEACGDSICGTIIGNSAGTDKYVGTRIIWDMEPVDATHWTNGQIHDPSNGKTYASKMSLSGDTLKVEGCVLVVCRAQNWTRK